MPPKSPSAHAAPARSGPPAAAERPRRGGAGVRPWGYAADRLAARLHPRRRNRRPAGKARTRAALVGRPRRRDPSWLARSRRAGPDRREGQPDASAPAWLQARRLDGVEPRNDALDIAVDDIGGLVEGDGRHCRGGVVADARQGAQGRLITREDPAMIPRHRPRAGQEIAARGRSSRGPAQAAITAPSSAAASASTAFQAKP